MFMERMSLFADDVSLYLESENWNTVYDRPYDSSNLKRGLFKIIYF